jgi:hypothetical protein
VAKWTTFANTSHIVAETQLTLKLACEGEADAEGDQEVSAGDDLIIETPDGGRTVGQVLSHDPNRGTFDIDGTRWSVRCVRSGVWVMDSKH